MTPAQERELRSRMLVAVETYKNWEAVTTRTQAVAWLRGEFERLTPETAAYILVACKAWRDTGGFKATTYAKIEAIIKENTR